jgi:hypothetical protein
LKLAEALVQRADAQRRLKTLKERMLRVAKVQEGDQPAEEPTALIEEYEKFAGALEDLIRRINRTNITAQVGPRSLTDALARRDVLRLRIAMFREVAAAATVTQARATKSEVRFRGTVSVSALQQQADALAREHRDLDASIQEANWRVDLED